MQSSHNKQFFYENMAGEFDNIMNQYEVTKRMKVVFDELLPKSLKDKGILDAGCGTGLFSAEAVKRGGKVTSLDLGEKLLKEVSKKCKSKLVVGSVTDIPFKDNSFDIVICTEVIEHTDDPIKAISELCRVVKPGGQLIITTPVKIWKFAVPIANFLKVRKYHALENWISRRKLKEEVEKHNIRIDRMMGFNIIPYFHPLFQPLISYFDKFEDKLGFIMVNMAIKGTKLDQ